MKLDVAGQYVNEIVIITVTDANTGSILVGATVAVYYAPEQRTIYLITDGNGKVEFKPEEEGGYDITVSMSRYKHATDAINVVKRECTNDPECADNKYCSDGKCVPVECPCGEISDHKCVEYDCCADADCEANEACKDHKCVLKILELEIIGPSEAVIGREVEYTVLDEKGGAVSSATIMVTYEDGTKETHTTDENGMIEFTPSASGKIIIDAKKEGYNDAQMSALATKPECESDAECGAGEICKYGICVKKPPGFNWLYVIIPLLIIILLILFFVMRKKKEKPESGSLRDLK